MNEIISNLSIFGKSFIPKDFNEWNELESLIEEKFDLEYTTIDIEELDSEDLSSLDNPSDFQSCLYLTEC